MSQNVQVMRLLYDGFGPLAHGADVPTCVAAHYNPDCEYHPVEEEEPVRGREAVFGDKIARVEFYATARNSERDRPRELACARPPLDNSWTHVSQWHRVHERV